MYVHYGNNKYGNENIVFSGFKIPGNSLLSFLFFSLQFKKGGNKTKEFKEKRKEKENQTTHKKRQWLWREETVLKVLSFASGDYCQPANPKKVIITVIFSNNNIITIIIIVGTTVINPKLIPTISIIIIIIITVLIVIITADTPTNPNPNPNPNQEQNPKRKTATTATLPVRTAATRRTK